VGGLVAVEIGVSVMVGKETVMTLAVRVMVDIIKTSIDELNQQQELI
jgi:hypothetical protein